jgi:hypothetical protein
VQQKILSCCKCDDNKTHDHSLACPRPEHLSLSTPANSWSHRWWCWCISQFHRLKTFD